VNHSSAARALTAGCLVAAFAAIQAERSPSSAPAKPAPYTTWSDYGGSADSAQYSALTQINRANVNQLQVAWAYQTGDANPYLFNPLVVDDVIYVLAKNNSIVALEAATGKELWAHENPRGRITTRGINYWESQDRSERRLLYSHDDALHAIDARTGASIPTFGVSGRVDLREGLDRDPSKIRVQSGTPGRVFEDLIIVGSATNQEYESAPGDIRAYDVRSGKLVWTFHTVPRPGEFGYETWPEDAWSYTGGANNWAGMALDERRGIVFVPTGSAAADFYGANRTGDNLFANALIALDAATGRRLWHFQAVRHDTWDRDLPAPPSLVTVTHAGRRIDAVAQTSKHGYVFLFDRTNGEPLFPIKYRRTPASDVEGERSADTQPFPTRPAPFARQMLTEDLLTRRTPEAHRTAVEAFRTFRSGGPFLPVAVGQETVVFPGFDGGAEWGGAAFDPETGVLYVNSNEMAWLAELGLNVTGTGPRATYLRACATCHRDDFTGAPPQIPSLAGIAGRRTPADLTKIIRQGAGRMPGNPTLPADTVAALVEYLRTGKSTATGDQPETPSPAHVKYRFTGFQKFIDAENYPAIAPPWGTLSAIDLNTGEYAWTVPLGEYPELAAQGIKNTGSENYGGPIVTAGGLVFIGATNFDRKFRAFDKATGELVWESLLPFSGNGTPCTYEADGRQFVVVPAGGGKGRGQFGARAESGGAYVAFALPRGGAGR